MKKILFILFVLCILLAGCGVGSDLPAKGDVTVFGSAADSVTVGMEETGNVERAPALPTLGESDLLTQDELDAMLIGTTRQDMHVIWGEPGNQLSGLDGEIWLAGNNTRIIVYFDGNDVVNEVKKLPVYDWGVTLTAKDVTARGLTIVCTQSGGEPKGELQTGSWYVVEQLIDGEWKKVEYTAINEDQVGWTMEAWMVPKEEAVEWTVDWSWLYEELSAGQYRIGKDIMDLHDTGEYERSVLYAAFTIE